MTCQYVIGRSRIWQKGTKGISDRGCWPNKPNGANIRCTNQIQGFRAKQTQCSYVNCNQSVTAKSGRLFGKFECERSIKDSVSKTLRCSIPPKQTGDSRRAGPTSAGRSKDALANEAGMSQKRIRLWKYDPHYGFADTPRTPGQVRRAVRGALPLTERAAASAVALNLRGHPFLLGFGLVWGWSFVCSLLPFTTACGEAATIPNDKWPMAMDPNHSRCARVRIRIAAGSSFVFLCLVLAKGSRRGKLW